MKKVNESTKDRLSKLLQKNLSTWISCTPPRKSVKANANTAAINYHFEERKSLQNCMDFVLRHAIGENDEMDLSVDEDREWLYNYLRICVISVFESVLKVFWPSSFQRNLRPSLFPLKCCQNTGTAIQELEKRLRHDAARKRLPGGLHNIGYSQPVFDHNRARQNLFRMTINRGGSRTIFTREICAFVMVASVPSRCPQEAAEIVDG